MKLTPKRIEMRLREIERLLSVLRSELHDLTITRMVADRLQRSEAENIIAVPLDFWSVR